MADSSNVLRRSYKTHSKTSSAQLSTVATFNLHLENAGHELVKILPLTTTTPIEIGRAKDDHCAKANGFFDRDYPSISRAHARITLDAKGRVSIDHP